LLDGDLPSARVAALTVTWGQDLIDFEADIDAHVQGRMSFQGSAMAQPGAWIELVGVGKRISGTVLLSAVEHHFQDGNWISRAEFGLGPQ
jgi:hypothetical protein